MTETMEAAKGQFEIERDGEISFLGTKSTERVGFRYSIHKFHWHSVVVA